MGDDANDPRVSFRIPESQLSWLDGMADKIGASRSDLLRQAVDFIREAQGDTLERQGEVKQEIEEIIELNKDRQRIHGWPGRVRGLFRRNLRNGMDPDGLRSVAHGYREHADALERLAETVPHTFVERGELVEATNRELRNALEAADLSNWYEAVENPHERHFSGVEDGRQERTEMVALVQGVVDRHEHLAAIFDDPEDAPIVLGRDLPERADEILPDGVDRDDLAELATELVRHGVRPEDVPDVIPTTDPSLDVEEIGSRVEEAGVEPAEEIEPATVQMGGETIEAELDDGDDSAPLPTSASETTQADLIKAQAAADGGRDPDSVPGAESSEVDTDMNDNNAENDDSIDYDEPDSEAVQERIEQLSLDVEDATEGSADV